MKYVALLFSACLCFGQVAREANETYREPEGRAKIARGMIDESRDTRQKPRDLMAALDVKPGSSVADIGTAAGYMLPYLAEAVGPKGRVFAEDIFPDFLESAKKHAARHSNITYVLGNEKSVELPANSVDLALILDAYHHFDYPEPMMASLRKALRPGGRVVIIEYHKNEKSMPNGRALQHVRGTQDEFVKEIEGFGFRAVSVKDFIPGMQWMGTFAAR